MRTNKIVAVAAMFSLIAACDDSGMTQPDRPFELKPLLNVTDPNKNLTDEEEAELRKVTGRERFLAEMNGMVPWGRLISLIEPYYPRRGRGQPLGLEKMLRIYLPQPLLSH